MDCKNISSASYSNSGCSCDEELMKINNFIVQKFRNMHITQHILKGKARKQRETCNEEYVKNSKWNIKSDQQEMCIFLALEITSLVDTQT